MKLYFGHGVAGKEVEQKVEVNKMNINKMTQEQIEDIKDKEKILNEIDYKNDFHVEFATIMLMRGFGYTPEKTKDGNLEKCLGGNQDFFYYCEIGKLVEKYLSNPYNFNLLETKVLDTKEELFLSQIKNCATNMHCRLAFSKRVMDSAKKGEIKKDIFESVHSILKKCEDILGEKNEFI